MSAILIAGDRTCPAGCGRVIPGSKYLCNIDAARQPAPMIALYSSLFDAGDLVGLAAAFAANLVKAIA